MKEAGTERHSSDFIDEVAACIKKRSKAIKYRGAELALDRVKEIEGGVENKVRRLDLDISYRVEAAPIKFRLIVWSDRWTWMDVRRRGKAGWAWSATIEGRFVGRDGAKRLVHNIEATLDVAHDKEPPSQIESIWKTNLAQGPKRL